MTISGQAVFDEASGEFSGVASALVQRASALPQGPQRDAFIAQIQVEMSLAKSLITRLGRGGVPQDEFVAGVDSLRAATVRLRGLNTAPLPAPAPQRRSLFRRR